MAENRRIPRHFSSRSRNELIFLRQRQRYVNHTTSQPHFYHTAPVHVHLHVPPPVVVLAPNLLIDPFDQRALIMARDPYALAQEYPRFYGAAVPPPPYATVSSPAPAVVPPPYSTVASPAPAAIPPAVRNVPAPTLNTIFSNLSISDHQASSRYGPAVPPLSEMINHWFAPGLPTAQTQAETRDEDEWIAPGYIYIPSTEVAAVSDRHNGPENSDGMERDSRRYILCPYNNYGQCRNEYCEYMHGATCYVCRMPRLDIYNEDRRKRHVEDCLLGMSIGKQCGLCEEHIPLSDTTRNFTILDNCNHCFCRPCFTSWRRQVNEQNTSFCPFCSTPFDISFRSKYWFDSQELKVDIQDYFDSVFQLRNNDLLRCRNFDFVLEKLFRE